MLRPRGSRCAGSRFVDWPCDGYAGLGPGGGLGWEKAYFRIWPRRLLSGGDEMDELQTSGIADVIDAFVLVLMSRGQVDPLAFDPNPFLSIFLFRS